MLTWIFTACDFVTGDDGAAVASDGSDVLAVFGADTTRGMINMLSHTQYFSARSICAHVFSHPELLQRPRILFI